MKEIVVISGKGGTGKTSLVASFASLATNAVFADCDVDAADLHLILDPSIRQRAVFMSGNEAVIDPEACSGCGRCREICRYGAVTSDQAGHYAIDPLGCEGCGVCVRFCPAGAIAFSERRCGEWYVSDTRFGSLVHARLGVAAENSGKLVSLVRREARKLAEQQAAELLLVDGPPGIGCPVIASITGADALVVVTEPTLSGRHDLRRVLELARHFGLRAYLVVNKWDINPVLADQLEADGCKLGATALGRISYDPNVTAAQIKGLSLIEHGQGQGVGEISRIWECLCSQM